MSNKLNKYADDTRIGLNQRRFKVCYRLSNDAKYILLIYNYKDSLEAIKSNPNKTNNDIHLSNIKRLKDYLINNNAHDNRVY